MSEPAGAPVQTAADFPEVSAPEAAEPIAPELSEADYTALVREMAGYEAKAVGLKQRRERALTAPIVVEGVREDDLPARLVEEIRSNRRLRVQKESLAELDTLERYAHQALALLAGQKERHSREAYLRQASSTPEAVSKLQRVRGAAKRELLLFASDAVAKKDVALAAAVHAEMQGRDDLKAKERDAIRATLWQIQLPRRVAMQAKATPLRDAAARTLYHVADIRGGQDAAIRKLAWARQFEGAGPVWD